MQSYAKTQNNAFKQNKPVSKTAAKNIFFLFLSNTLARNGLWNRETTHTNLPYNATVTSAL